MSNKIVGWFDDPEQTIPSHDPPHDAPCPFCGFAISADDVRTHCLMYAEGYANRSYFYRTHRTCADAEPMLAMDGWAFDLIKRMEARGGDGEDWSERSEHGTDSATKEEPMG